MIEASQKRNVIPGRCEVTVDCRLLPGQTEAEAEAIVLEWLGEGDYELEWRGGQGGTRSELGTPLWAAIEEFVGGARARRAVWRRSAWPGSPTPTGCARRSARSPTASSR